MTKNRAHIIVLGNEKGGSGKSTSAMHISIALLRLGYRVGTIDLDSHQGTFTRYFKNRWKFIEKHRHDIPSPDHICIPHGNSNDRHERHKEEQEFLTLALADLERTKDFIIIDTPGRDCYLTRLAHAHADTLITPVNDSFIDLDLIAHIDPDTHLISAPSVYTKMVLEQRERQYKLFGRKFDWIVMRNRLSHINARNKNDIGNILFECSRNFNFRLAPGFGERVIFRELFLKGLTLLDLKEDPDFTMTISHLSARQEVRHLIKELAPETLSNRPARSYDSLVSDHVMLAQDILKNAG
jgi:chromosome partitioning protein